MKEAFDAFASADVIVARNFHIPADMMHAKEILESIGLLTIETIVLQLIFLKGETNVSEIELRKVILGSCMKIKQIMAAGGILPRALEVYEKYILKTEKYLFQAVGFQNAFSKRLSEFV